MVMKITAKLICLVWSELDEQNWKSCQEVKKECFREVVSESVEELLDVALSFSNAGWSSDHPLPRLTIIDVLVDVLYNIRKLPVNRTEFIHDVVAHVFCKMVIDLTGMLEGSTNDIRRSRENTIHPVTVLLVQYLEFFRRNGGMMQSVLGTGDCGVELTMIGSWVSKLSKDVRVMFAAEGQRCIYILNNIDYVHQLKHHPGGFITSIELQMELRRLRRQYISGYLDECWAPLVRYLGGDSLKTRRRLSLDKFLEAFFTIHDSQVTWRVRTRLKERLRKEIVELVVPEYASFLQALQENPRWRCSCWLRVMRSEKPTRTAAWLELVIAEIFER